MAHYHLTQLFQKLPLNDQFKCVRSSVIRHLLEEAPAANYFNAKTDEKSKCQLCGTNYNDTIQNRILVPFKRPNRFLRRLLQNTAENLTEYQKLSLKKYYKYAAKQKLIRTCQLCNHKQELVLENNTPAPDDKKPIGSKEKIKSKKKKKINAYAGLNKNAVLTVKKARRIMTMDDIQIKRKLDTDLNKSVICIDSTPRRKINNAEFETSDFINLVTPKSTSKKSKYNNPTSSAVINLCSPDTATKKSSVIDLSTPCSTKKKKRSNVVLASSTKPAKKVKKLDALSKLLQPDSKLNNTVSKLEQFLQTISK